MRAYLDYAATTPVLPAVRDAMAKWIDCGNPSSLYLEGRAAKAAIDEAREAVSNELRCNFPDVLFTGSGTESASMAIVGAALAADPSRRPKILLSASEHHCVTNTRLQLERLGFEVALVGVDRYARVNVDVLRAALSKGDVLLFAAMHANNELGTFNPAAEIGELCHEFGTLYYCDAVQTFGKLPVSGEALNADLISISAHKFGGPKGVGALYIRPGTPLKPILAGGGQEREMRGGTENVAAIVGMGEAARQFHGSNRRKLDPPLSETLLKHLIGRGATPTVPSGVERLPSHVHVRFPGCTAETFLIALDRFGVSAASGAACSSGSVEPSHVLVACGYSENESKEGLRFTLGPETKEEEIKFANNAISKVLEQLRQSTGGGTRI